MSKTKPKFIIIDGNALIHRSFHALPPLANNKGELLNAVYGFTSILLKVLKEIKPEYAAVTFDKKAPTFRHKEFKEYKAKRVKQPNELYEQIPKTKELVEAFNIPVYEIDGYEADDVIGTIGKQASRNAGKQVLETVIVTGDLDTLQLVDEQTKVYTLKKGITDTTIYGEKEVKSRYGLKPEQMIDYKALAGDQSDNIPGVAGIGEKSATTLLKEFKTLDNIYKNIDSEKIKERQRKLLKEQKKQAYLSQKLVTIVLDVPIEFKLEDCQMQPIDQQKVTELLQRFGFKSLLARIPGLTSGEQVSLFDKPSEQKTPEEQSSEPTSYKLQATSYSIIDSEEKYNKFITELKKQKEFCLDTETTSTQPFEAKLLGISFSWKKDCAYYLPVTKHVSRSTYREALNKILADKNILKTGHNIKYDLEILENHGYEVNGIFFDSMIASYLLNPGTRQHGLDSVAFTELGHQMIPIKSLIGEGKKQIPMEEVPLEKLAEYSCEDADYTWQLTEKFQKDLKEKNITGLMEKIEVPLIPVLAELEKNGVKIDAKFLENMSKQVTTRLNQLAKKIYKHAGLEFNINSPQQLKEVLFGKLEISSRHLKHTKTGISTAASELVKLRDEHPIIKLIEEHRELAKLRNTYLDALPKLINPKTKRVHTSFNQTVTATGRLSSSDPNLQNIPIRTELGQKVRQAFVSERGFKILAADYSQIELRIIASISQDKKMLAAFKNNEDIHTRTAAEINECEPEDVTKKMRREAKTINFGIIYGMGVHGLAAAADITREEAREFLDKYFDLYDGIKQYIERTKELARQEGFVETLFGRRRYLPEIHSGVQQVQAAGERMAINMPIQGTAADLMKLAMIHIYNKLPEISKKSKMLLQVHDELVFEVPNNEVGKVAKFVKKEMEDIFKLRVPIKVDVETGNNWGKLEKI